jgi:paraquat-inducible protein A
MEAVACLGCDLLHAATTLPAGGRARCVRCGGALSVPGPHAYERLVATAIAAFVTFVVANTEPLMQLSELGRVASTTVAGSALEMWAQGSRPTAIVVALCSIAAPGAYLLMVLAALLSSRKKPAPPWTGKLVHWASAIHPWAMPEVMLLGTLVAYVKISELADASPGVGMYATGALAVLIASLSSSMNLAALWSRIRWMR